MSNMMQFGTDVSAQRVGPISRGKAIEVEFRFLLYSIIVYVSSADE